VQDIFDEDPLKDAEKLRKQQLTAFAETLAEKRKKAVEARRLSGIEDIWLENENYYSGIDEFNQGNALQKSATLTGRATYRKKSKANKRSTVFVNITAPYVDLVSAREGDMLIPTNDKPFSIKPTPVPDIEKSLDSTEPMEDGQMTEGEAAKQFMEEVQAKAEGAEEQIWDWLAESGWHTELRKLIAQKNKIGTGCLKGPFPIKRKQRRMTKNPETGAIALEIADITKPASKMVDVWNLYPDPACVDDIHEGSYIFEKDIVTGKQLEELKGSDYINDEIDIILKEGPNKKYITEDAKNRTKKTPEMENYEIWYFHGIAKKEELEAANCQCEQENMNVCVVMVNNHVIKATQSIYDSGEFPYDLFVYQKREGYWAGLSVADQVKTAQNMVNAASRNLMDNAGISAGPQLIIRDGIVVPADGKWEITPLKVWRVDEDADMQQVQHAFTSIVIPTMQQELEAIIRLALEFAERATSMPLLLQGQQGAATETVGGMTILQNNSNTVLRRAAKLFDDVIERHIGRYYEYLMLHGDNDQIKGDFNIIAQGSSALYERDAQNQFMPQLLQLVDDPGFNINKERLVIEILKSQKISPDRVLNTEDEKKQIQSQPPAEDPRIKGAKEVAQLKAQSDMQIEQLKQQNDRQDIELKQKETESNFALKLQMQQKDQEFQMRIKEMELQLEMLKLSQMKDISLDNIKSALSRDAMKLGVQKELSYADMRHQKDTGQADKDHEMSMEVIKPLVEPAGRAEPGHSYTQ
jgi:hypothetical protein